MKSVREEIEALPEPKRSRMRAFYDDDEWKYSWELNGRPFQIEPQSDDWRVWTIIAPPKSGKSYAGEHWVIQKFVHDHEGSGLCLFAHPQSVHMSYKPAFMAADMWQGYFEYRNEGDVFYEMKDVTSGKTLTFADYAQFERGHFKGTAYDFIWGDELLDPTKVITENPQTKKFLFTHPTKVPEGSTISRAGDPRAF